MEITLTIQKSKVYDEVSQTTEYTGDKMPGDEGAYDRIKTVDEDSSELERFWNECRADIAKSFVRMLCSEDMYASSSSSTPSANGDYYKVVLNVSESFDQALLPGMSLGLFSYFVQSITAKWYVYANKGEAEAYRLRAVSQLDEVRQKAFYKKAPTRPRYS